MLFYMRQHSLDNSIAQATATSKASTDSMPRLKRKRNLVPSDDEEDIGEAIPGLSVSLPNGLKTPTSLQDASSPSPMKKQKQTPSGETQMDASSPFKSLISQYSYTGSENKTPRRIITLGKTSSRDTSPELEESLPTSAPLSIPFSQNTTPPSSVLPASYTSSPAGTPAKTPRAWEIEDDPGVDNFPTTPTSTTNGIKRMVNKDEDYNEHSQPMSLELNGRSSDDDTARPWTSNVSGLSKSTNLQKQFRSKAKKERRNKVINPLGFSNGMQSESGKRSSIGSVSMGVNKKHRRPGI
jgi:hypothetical protein